MTARRWIALAVGKYALCLFCGNIENARAQGLPVEEFNNHAWKETAAIYSGSNGTLALMNQAPHPNAAKLFINWLLSREGQMAVQKDGGVNDSLRVDIPKTDLRPMVRRKDGAKYMVTWKAEWMDAEPMQKVVNQALAKSGKQP